MEGEGGPQVAAVSKMTAIFRTLRDQKVTAAAELAHSHGECAAPVCGCG